MIVSASEFHYACSTAMAEARELGHDPHPWIPDDAYPWRRRTACRLCGARLLVRISEEEVRVEKPGSRCPKAREEVAAGEEHVCETRDLEFEAMIAAPGYGQSWRCQVCRKPWVKLGGGFAEPELMLHLLEPEDVR